MKRAVLAIEATGERQLMLFLPFFILIYLTNRPLAAIARICPIASS